MKRIINFTGFFASILVTFAIAGTAEADHSWGSYHWASSENPFTLKLGDNLTNSWDSYLLQTSADWSSSTILETTIVAGNTNNKRGKNTPKNCTATTGQGEVCNSKYGANGWLGIASIWASGNHITAGTVKLNDTYFTTTTYNKPAWKNLVMCQEVGHLFGLSHQDEAFNNANLGTCMDYTNNPDSNQQPNAHDYAQLEQIYSHLDSSTTLANSVSLLASDSNNEADWGLEVHRSPDGRSSIFVKDLGNGNRVIRHVYWVEPRGNHHRD